MRNACRIVQLRFDVNLLNIVVELNAAFACSRRFEMESIYNEQNDDKVRNLRKTKK